MIVSFRGQREHSALLLANFAGAIYHSHTTWKKGQGGT